MVMEINIPGLLRIKPNALNKLGKYLRKEGFSLVPPTTARE
jgi:hypothetical protein